MRFSHTLIFFKAFNLTPQVQQQLNETDFFVDDDEFDLFKKPEPTAINIGQPKDENYTDLVMIFDDDEAKI